MYGTSTIQKGNMAILLTEKIARADRERFDHNFVSLFFVGNDNASSFCFCVWKLNLFPGTGDPLGCFLHSNFCHSKPCAMHFSIQEYLLCIFDFLTLMKPPFVSRPLGFEPRKKKEVDEALELWAPDVPHWATGVNWSSCENWSNVYPIIIPCFPIFLGLGCFQLAVFGAKLW